MVPLDRALVSSYRLSIVTMSAPLYFRTLWRYRNCIIIIIIIIIMSLTAAVWLQFATQVFRGGIGRLACIGTYANNQVTTFTFRAQATTCSKHHIRTVMDAGCECAP